MSGPSKYLKKTGEGTEQDAADHKAVGESRIIKFPRLLDYIEMGLKETCKEILLSNQPLDKMIDQILSEFAKQEVYFAKYLTSRIYAIMDEFNAATVDFQRRRSPFDIKRFIKTEEALKARVQSLEERLAAIEESNLSDLKVPDKEEPGLTNPLTPKPDIGGGG